MGDIAYEGCKLWGEIKDLTKESELEALYQLRYIKEFEKVDFLEYDGWKHDDLKKDMENIETELRVINSMINKLELKFGITWSGSEKRALKHINQIPKPRYLHHFIFDGEDASSHRAIDKLFNGMYSIKKNVHKEDNRIVEVFCKNKKNENKLKMAWGRLLKGNDLTIDNKFLQKDLYKEKDHKISQNFAKYDKNLLVKETTKLLTKLGTPQSSPSHIRENVKTVPVKVPDPMDTSAIPQALKRKKIYKTDKTDKNRKRKLEEDKENLDTNKNQETSERKKVKREPIYGSRPIFPLPHPDILQLVSNIETFTENKIKRQEWKDNPFIFQNLLNYVIDGIRKISEINKLIELNFKLLIEKNVNQFEYENVRMKYTKLSKMHLQYPADGGFFVHEKFLLDIINASDMMDELKQDMESLIFPEENNKFKTEFDRQYEEFISIVKPLTILNIDYIMDHDMDKLFAWFMYEINNGIYPIYQFDLDNPLLFIKRLMIDKQKELRELSKKPTKHGENINFDLWNRFYENMKQDFILHLDIDEETSNIIFGFDSVFDENHFEELKKRNKPIKLDKNVSIQKSVNIKGRSDDTSDDSAPEKSKDHIETWWDKTKKWISENKIVVIGSAISVAVIGSIWYAFSGSTNRQASGESPVQEVSSSINCFKDIDGLDACMQQQEDIMLYERIKHVDEWSKSVNPSELENKYGIKFNKTELAIFQNGKFNIDNYEKVSNIHFRIIQSARENDLKLAKEKFENETSSFGIKFKKMSKPYELTEALEYVDKEKVIEKSVDDNIKKMEIFTGNDVIKPGKETMTESSVSTPSGSALSVSKDQNRLTNRDFMEKVQNVHTKKINIANESKKLFEREIGNNGIQAIKHISKLLNSNQIGILTDIFTDIPKNGKEIDIFLKLVINTQSALMKAGIEKNVLREQLANLIGSNEENFNSSSLFGGLNIEKLFTLSVDDPLLKKFDVLNLFVSVSKNAKTLSLNLELIDYINESQGIELEKNIQGLEKIKTRVNLLKDEFETKKSDFKDLKDSAVTVESLEREVERKRRIAQLYQKNTRERIEGKRGIAQGMMAFSTIKNMIGCNLGEIFNAPKRLVQWWIGNKKPESFKDILGVFGAEVAIQTILMYTGFNAFTLIVEMAMQSLQALSGQIPDTTWQILLSFVITSMINWHLFDLSRKTLQTWNIPILKELFKKESFLGKMLNFGGNLAKISVLVVSILLFFNWINVPLLSYGINPILNFMITIPDLLRNNLSNALIGLGVSSGTILTGDVILRWVGVEKLIRTTIQNSIYNIGTFLSQDLKFLDSSELFNPLLGIFKVVAWVNPTSRLYGMTEKWRTDQIKDTKGWKMKLLKRAVLHPIIWLPTTCILDKLIRFGVVYLLFMSWYNSGEINVNNPIFHFLTREMGSIAFMINTAKNASIPEIFGDSTPTHIEKLAKTEEIFDLTEEEMKTVTGVTSTGVTSTALSIINDPRKRVASIIKIYEEQSLQNLNASNSTETFYNELVDQQINSNQTFEQIIDSTVTEMTKKVAQESGKK